MSPQFANNTSQPIPSAPTPSTSAPSHAPSKEPRDSQKNKFAMGLVDQTVKLLTEAWRPDIIPQAFRPPRTSSSNHGPSGPIDKQRQNVASSTSATISSSASVSSSDCDADGPLLPIRPFVHEILRRSRTSGTVLQTALCYLAAIRPKLEDMAQQERAGLRNYFDSETRIMPATEAELAREVELAKLDGDLDFVDATDTSDKYSTDLVKTVKAMDEDHPEDCSTSSDETPSAISASAPTEATSWTSVTPSGSQPTPASKTQEGPSPLLCPRRAFLASIILASKFTQDKCYSNRAWAKLSGLPAREVGRYERALGQALEWRLWVGKKSIAEVAPSLPIGRPIVRAQTESSVLSSTTPRGPFLAPEAITFKSDGLSMVAKNHLRRVETLPARAFAAESASFRGVTPHGSQPVLVDPNGIYDTKLAAGFMRPSPPSTSTAATPATDFIQRHPYSTSSGLPVATSTATYTASPDSYASLSGPGSSPGTPGLTYSPSCTDVSSGSQTIQVTTLEDQMLTSYNPAQSWPSHSDRSLTTTTPPAKPNHGYTPSTTKGSVVHVATSDAINIVFSETSPYVPVWGHGHPSSCAALGEVNVY